MTNKFKHGDVQYEYVFKPRYYLRRLQIKLVAIFSKDKANQINAKCKADYKEMPLKYVFITDGKRLKETRHK